MAAALFSRVSIWGYCGNALRNHIPILCTAQARCSRGFKSTSNLQVLLVQKKAPAFSGKGVVNGQVREINSEKYAGKYIVLLFYPNNFSYVCPTEIIAFSARMSEFHMLATEVIGISVDSEYSHLAWINTPKKKGGLGKIDFPLLSDSTKKISTDFGVISDDNSVAHRGLFIIDGKGIIRYMGVNDLGVGRSVDETMRLLKAFKFTEVHGEMCPAGWKPEGKSRSIKPEPTAAKAYFEETNDHT